jgi:hypothetical protein
MRRSFVEFVSRAVRVAAFCALFACAHAAAQAPFPSVRITGFVSAPVNSCATPFAEFTVDARGDRTTSDTFLLFANGVQIYRWSGETMDWVRGSNDTYAVVGELVNLAPNTVVTASILTYDQANPSGPNFVAGNAVYQSQASWNCTTGAQVGVVSNVDLRPRDVPTLAIHQLALLGAALFVAVLRLRVRMHTKPVPQ